MRLGHKDTSRKSVIGVHQTGATSCEGMPFGSSRKVRSQVSLLRPYGLLIRKVETWTTTYIGSSGSAARRRRAIEDAIQTAVSRAAQSLKNLRWCEVVQTRGHIEGGKVQHYQVAIKIGFIVNDVRAE
jgi:flavin-binding protein dodecin